LHEILTSYSSSSTVSKSASPNPESCDWWWGQSPLRPWAAVESGDSSSWKLPQPENGWQAQEQTNTALEIAQNAIIHDLSDRRETTIVTQRRLRPEAPIPAGTIYDFCQADRDFTPEILNCTLTKIIEIWDVDWEAVRIVPPHLVFYVGGTYGWNHKKDKPAKWSGDPRRKHDKSKGGWFDIQGTKTATRYLWDEEHFGYGDPRYDWSWPITLLMQWLRARHLTWGKLSLLVSVPPPCKTDGRKGFWLLSPWDPETRTNWRSENLVNPVDETQFRFGWHGTEMNNLYKIIAAGAMECGFAMNEAGGKEYTGIFYHINDRAHLCMHTYMPYSCLDRSGWCVSALIQLMVTVQDPYGRPTKLKRKNSGTHQNICYPETHKIIGVWFHCYHIVEAFREPATIWTQVETIPLAECELDPSDSYEILAARAKERNRRDLYL